MSSHRRDVAPKHRKKSRHLAPALWVGGFLLLGVVVVMIALAPSADPLEGPSVVPGGLAPVDVKARSVDAGNVSRDLERTESLPTRRQVLLEVRRQERVEERREARAEKRREAREAVQTESPTPTPTTSVATSTQSTQTGASGCGGLPADLVMVCQHESGGNPRAYNADGCVGGCYGLFQMSGAYMGEWAARAGYSGYGAGFWPSDVQKAVAIHMYNQPNGLYTYWCQWTTYC